MFKVQVAVVTLALALSAPLASRTSASGASAAIVYEWNQILQDTVPTPHNPLTPRYFSMMHIAMFDAVNAIERDFTPYRVSLRYAGGSAEAAAAQAAHDVLVAMLPCRDRNLRRGARPATRPAAVGVHPPRRRRRRPRGEGDPGVAEDRRLGRLSLPAVLGAAGSRALAADAAEQSDGGIHAPAERGAHGTADRDPVPATAAAVAHQRAVRGRPQRGRRDRQVGQRQSNRRADRDRAAVGGNRHHGVRHGHQLHVDLEQHRA